jgi:hypothetical protein
MLALFTALTNNAASVSRIRLLLSIKMTHHSQLAQNHVQLVFSAIL